MLEITYQALCGAMLVVMAFMHGYLAYALWVARRHAPAEPAGGWPRVALILPCKGLEPHLEEHLRRHFRHDYPDYRVVFTLADEGDPALPVIRKVIATEGRPAALVIAPRLDSCVEKVSNQLAALAAIGADAAVIVNADSDGLPRDPAWLRSLVAALDHYAVASGFRWYIPTGPSFVGRFQSAWDATWCLLHCLGKTVWGGAMAFRRTTCEHLRFADHLRTAVTDDLVVQVCTLRARERVGFAPGGMMISEPAERFGDFFRWAVRQFQIVRWVTPWLWFLGFATANVYIAFFALSVALLLAPGLAPAWPPPAVALGGAALGYASRGLLLHRLACALLPGHRDRTRPLRWVYCWGTPLADLLAPCIVYASLAGTIRWRGVSYRRRAGRIVRV